MTLNLSIWSEGYSLSDIRLRSSTSSLVQLSFDPPHQWLLDTYPDDVSTFSGTPATLGYTRFGVGSTETGTLPPRKRVTEFLRVPSTSGTWLSLLLLFHFVLNSSPISRRRSSPVPRLTWSTLCSETRSLFSFLCSGWTRADSPETYGTVGTEESFKILHNHLLGLGVLWRSSFRNRHRRFFVFVQSKVLILMKVFYVFTLLFQEALKRGKGRVVSGIKCQPHNEQTNEQYRTERSVSDPRSYISHTTRTTGVIGSRIKSRTVSHP